MKTKPITPYARLLEEFTEYVNAVEYRRKQPMFTYPKTDLDAGWNLTCLYERVAAAEQLGYEVKLSTTPAGLTATYVKQLPPRPWVTK